MKCPLCREPAEVRDSRARAASTYRRRVCRGCGHRFTTVEFVPPPGKDGKPQGLVAARAKGRGITSTFDVRVTARFVNGELRLSIPQQMPAAERKGDEP